MLQYPLSDVEMLSWLLVNVQSGVGGIYFRDTLPLDRKVHTTPTIYIANTAKLSHPTGTHWVALTLGLERAEYFDSLGHAPCAEFVEFLGPHYVYCATPLQATTETSCGYLCLFYAVCRSHHLTFETIVKICYAAGSYAIMATVQELGPL